MIDWLNIASRLESGLALCFQCASQKPPTWPAHTALPNPLTLDPMVYQQLVGYFRINHVGELCAQALYQAQARWTRHPDLKTHFHQAQQEELEHLAWTSHVLYHLNASPSFANPFWFLGAYTLGTLAAWCGDQWNLGFLAETEKQVGAHLHDQMTQLPNTSEVQAFREILSQMYADETRHAEDALHSGGLPLPKPIPQWMHYSASAMKTFAYWY